MATKYKLHNFTQLKGREIFVDANVIIYLFWPSAQHAFEQNYAHVFRNLLRQGNKMFTDFLVISEVVNRVVRIEREKLNPTQKFKDFRNSPQGEKALEDIYIIVRHDILKHFQIIGKNIQKQDVENFLTVDGLDFIDKAIESICQENSFVLLTNDKDFKNSNLEILTGNPNIFN
ncbi:MAG: PIN domain-containing protein [Bacteroidota bacterium]|nr:PIN domain-containing protein [Bacteroidota bacterium]